MDLASPPAGCKLPRGLENSLETFVSSDADALVSARAYTRHLAQSHYENFHVGTWLFPAEVREHAYAIYAYCRWADDLADETGDPALSLELLKWWRELLHQTFEGRCGHPVFVALADTITQFKLSREPFDRLLDAFEQDQRVFRYETFEQLVEYCHGSADPVGHLVLALLGYHDEERRALSDKTCTALQLANHWQDIENDLRRGRIYVPQEDLDRFEVNEEDLAMPSANAAVVELIRFEVERARDWFRQGLPLTKMVRGRARFDIDLFSRGGMAILDAIEAQGYDVLRKRPKVGKFKKARLLSGALLRGIAGGSSKVSANGATS